MVAMKLPGLALLAISSANCCEDTLALDFPFFEAVHGEESADSRHR
jgi:hypothetical protein